MNEDISSTPGVDVVAISPEMAERWLGRNIRNRNRRNKVVDRYADDMAAGRWRFTGDGIKFSNAGHLLDGQHRLLAVLKSGATVVMTVTTGLDDEAQDVMDTGAKRTGADVLSMRDIKNAVTVAALCRVIAVGLDDTDPLSHGRILEMIEQDPTLVPLVDRALSFSIRIPPTALAYAYWRLWLVDNEAVDLFFQAWSTLVNLPQGSPILALNRKLSAGGGRSQIVRKETVASIFLAWNAWRRGESRTLIKVQSKADGGLSLPTPI